MKLKPCRAQHGHNIANQSTRHSKAGMSSCRAGLHAEPAMPAVCLTQPALLCLLSWSAMQRVKSRWRTDQDMKEEEE